ncbi:hypothetical protein [uncultured Acinetobacter sp.]|uniref:hypothetical protein n=1 Tax=uncultured Acinetobacter sp. TaxID=165433 RepID=UPI002629ADEE|nr:hypothetical protein [uncultured Acinetobacter sp.]
MSCNSNLFAHDEAVVQQVASIQPYTRAEIQTALQSMQQHMNQKIEAWGKTLTQNDFERTWRGRELTKAKRQEVCGIYQSVVNDMYNAAYINRGRLSIAGQKLLQDRNAFIQSLGFKDNRIDTQMGFYCRLR